MFACMSKVAYKPARCACSLITPCEPINTLRSAVNTVASGRNPIARQMSTQCASHHPAEQNERRMKNATTSTPEKAQMCAAAPVVSQYTWRNAEKTVAQRNCAGRSTKISSTPASFDVRKTNGSVFAQTQHFYVRFATCSEHWIAIDHYPIRLHFCDKCAAQSDPHTQSRPHREQSLYLQVRTKTTAGRSTH